MNFKRWKEITGLSTDDLQYGWNVVSTRMKLPSIRVLIEATSDCSLESIKTKCGSEVRLQKAPIIHNPIMSKFRVSSNNSCYLIEDIKTSNTSIANRVVYDFPFVKLSSNGYIDISCFILPYPVYTANGPFKDRHLYSIAEMEKLYTNLEIDNALLYLMTPYAVQHANGGLTSNFEDYGRRVLNKFNEQFFSEDICPGTI